MIKKLIPFILLLSILGCSKEDVGPQLIDNGGVSTIVPLEKCENGFAGDYPCNDYDLLAYISLEDLGGIDISGNDSWGWTDPSTLKEYALMGTSAGVNFIDISDPVHPINLGFLPTATVSKLWRDIKVYKNHAFVVSEAADHGMQVFDLTRLRNVDNAPEEFTADAHYTEFGSAHNIVINETKGFAYAVGTQTFSGGPHFVNIQDPINPVAAGGYANGLYSHDAQVVTYKGPDTDYTGKEIFIGSNGSRGNGDKVIILDVTDKKAVKKIAEISYKNAEYTHQGWFTEDLKYFILGDELDEQEVGNKTRTIVFDFTDLDNPVLHKEYLGNTTAIDHNGYVKGDTYYQANYTAGVRMIDISDIENKNMNEIGFFDTYPEHDKAAFNGVWNVYPYFPSGNIIISDFNSGFFIIRKSGT